MARIGLFVAPGMWEQRELLACGAPMVQYPSSFSDFLQICKTENFSGVVLVGLDPGLVEEHIKQELRESGLSIPMVFAQLRGLAQEQWPGEIQRTLDQVSGLAAIPWQKKKTIKKVLIIGGGVAGLETAYQLQKRGIPLVLIEKEGVLGGMLLEFSSLSPWVMCPQEWMDERLEALENDAQVQIYTNTELTKLTGHVGDFSASLNTPHGLIHEHVGSIVLALGSRVERVQNGFSQGEALLRGKKKYKKVIMYCPHNSPLGLYNALRLCLLMKEAWAGEIYVLAQDIQVAAGYEELYRQARQAGVTFIKHQSEPQIKEGSITCQEQYLGALELEYDLLLIEEKITPTNIPLDIVQEDNVHLYPVGTSRRGIYMVGNCRMESDFPHTVQDSQVAAGEIHNLLKPGFIPYQQLVQVDDDKCAFCLTCVRICPHAAVDLDLEKQVAAIEASACAACGICVAQCPAKAINYLSGGMP